MTEMLEDAIAMLRLRSEEEQNQAAEALLNFLARDAPTYRLTSEQQAEVDQTLKGLRDGTERFATDEEVAAMWRRFGV